MVIPSTLRKGKDVITEWKTIYSQQKTPKTIKYYYATGTWALNYLRKANPRKIFMFFLSIKWFRNVSRKTKHSKIGKEKDEN